MVLTSIEVSLTEPLEYKQEYQEDLISDFISRLEDKIQFQLNGYGNCIINLEYNPKTRKFKLIDCTPRFKLNVENVLISDFKNYI